MRQLEARCGTALLERVGKRAFPTPAGAVLLEHAGRAFAELEAAQEALRQLRGVVAGRLRLGTGATASIHLLPPLLRRMRARYPELELIVVTGNAPEIAAAVAANELDVALVTLPVTGRQLAGDAAPARPAGGGGPAVPGLAAARRAHRGRADAPPAHRLRARRHHPARDRRLVPSRRRAAPDRDGAGQRGGHQEAGGRGPRRLGEPGHGGAGRGALGRALHAAALARRWCGAWASCAGATSPRRRRSACSWPRSPASLVKIVRRDARQPVAQRGEPLGAHRGDVVLPLETCPRSGERAR